MHTSYFLVVLAALIITGCGRHEPSKTSVDPESSMPSKSPKQMELSVTNQSQQQISKLNEADLKQLQDQRQVVQHYLGDPASKEKYKSAAGKLGTIRALLQSGVFKPNQTHELQCLGVVLGDVFVQELNMEWIIVEDKQGRDPAIRMPGTSIILYPITMISKRIESGEKVDVFELFNGSAAKIEQLKTQAEK